MLQTRTPKLKVCNIIDKMLQSPVKTASVCNKNQKMLQTIQFQSNVCNIQKNSLQKNTVIPLKIVTFAKLYKKTRKQTLAK